MASGYSQSPKLIKGALIRFSDSALVPIPNIIVFQYNPDSLKRSFKLSKADADDQANQDELSQPYDPQESLTLKLEFDATDALEAPASHPVAVVSGVADRIAAMEVLLYPGGDADGDSALGSLLSSISTSMGAAFGAKEGAIPPKRVPVVLLFFGPGRIVPVRITEFSVDETAFSPLLYPIHATVSLTVKVLDLTAFKDDPSATAEIAKAAYRFTRGQTGALALANLANSAESAGMLPI